MDNFDDHEDNLGSKYLRRKQELDFPESSVERQSGYMYLYAIYPIFNVIVNCKYALYDNNTKANFLLSAKYINKDFTSLCSFLT